MVISYSWATPIQEEWVQSFFFSYCCVVVQILELLKSFFAPMKYMKVLWRVQPPTKPLARVLHFLGRNGKFGQLEKPWTVLRHRLLLLGLAAQLEDTLATWHLQGKVCMGAKLGPLKFAPHLRPVKMHIGARIFPIRSMRCYSFIHSAHRCRIPLTCTEL